MSRIRFSAVLTVLAAVVVMFIAGCFSSHYTVGRPEDAKIDPAYVGDWLFPADNGQKLTMAIRNLDGRQYLVEWTENNEIKRYVAFITDVKGASFGQLRKIREDALLDDEFIIVRVENSPDKITLRQLDEKFFQDKPITSSDDLRKIIEANLDDKQMYNEKETIVATRIKGDAKAAAGAPDNSL